MTSERNRWGKGDVIRGYPSFNPYIGQEYFHSMRPSCKKLEFIIMTNNCTHIAYIYILKCFTCMCSFYDRKREKYIDVRYESE